MNGRTKLAITIVVAGLILLSSVGLGLIADPEPVDDSPGLLGGLAVTAGIAIGAWKLLRQPSDDDLSRPPWGYEGAIVSDRPEASSRDATLSGTSLTDQVDMATEAGRESETVEAGIETIRPVLRAALSDALVQSGQDRSTVEANLETGTWTDDPVAAAVIDEAVPPPTQSLRRRLWAWLFPEKAIRYRIARTVSAIEHTTDSAFPGVVGERAPRPVPIAKPTISDLRRVADGSLQQSVDGLATTREPKTNDQFGRVGDTDSNTPAEMTETTARTARPEDTANWDDVDGDVNDR